MTPSIEPGMTPAERIKLYRRRAGLTQEQAAQLKGCTVSAWRKWESGERHVASFADWVEIARIVRVNDLYKLTGLPVGQMPDDPPEHPAIPAIRSALLSVRPNLDAQPDPARIGAAVDFAWHAWQTSPDNHTRVGTMLPDLLIEVRAASGSDPAHRREVSRIAARLFFLLRAYTKWVGAHDLTLVAAEKGMTAAADTGDLAYEAAAAWNTAMMLSTRGHVEESAAVARDAVALAEGRLSDGPPDLLGMYGALHLLLAVEYSRLRDEHHAFASLDAAARSAARTGELNCFRTVFGPTNVRVYESAVTLELGRAREAIRLAERVDVSAMPSSERRFSHLFGLARGYVQRKEDLAAIAMLRQAAREYPQGATSSPAARAVVRELLRRETPTTRPELRPLAETIGVA
jgi:transcriptional regulator with XRE-family HTH domain